MDTNLEADNTFEITIKTTDVIEIITVKNCTRVVIEHLNTFCTSKFFPKKVLLQMIFKLPISITIGYNSAMRIGHIK